MLSDKTPNPISYLLEGTSLEFLTAAPLGSTMPWTTMPATPSNGLAGGPWGPCPAEEVPRLKLHSEHFFLERHQFRVQLRACMGSLGRPCQGTTKPL